LSLAWNAAVPLLGEAAASVSLVASGMAALVFCALVAAGLWRLHRHPGAWADDLRHPVRHLFVATMPVALLLLAGCAVAAGLHGLWLHALWWVGCLVQLAVTVWVLARAWLARPGLNPTAPWPVLTPSLVIPIVGNVLVPIAGVPLGHTTWAAVQFSIGLLFWPLVMWVLLQRWRRHGLWPERLLPSTFIFVAPPAAVGISALRFDAAPEIVWAIWGLTLLTLVSLAPLLRRIAALPFSMVHWGMSFPMAAATALTLRLATGGAMSVLSLALLAITSLLVAALALATVRGLRDGTLLKPEAITITSASVSS